MNPLPPPQVPFSNWSQFVQVCWAWGRRYTDIGVLHKWLDHAHGEMTREYQASEHLIRPSGNIDCAMKPYLIEQGFVPEGPSGSAQVTFNVGHLLHAHAHAYIESAIPDGFWQSPEERVDLWDIPWWPQDEERARRYGTADLVIGCEDDEAAHSYFGGNLPAQFHLVDYKSSSGTGWRKHNTWFPNEDVDTFGSLSQLAVYREALGLVDDTTLALISRDGLSEQFHLAARPVAAAALDEEIARVKDRVTNPQAHPEKLEVWGKKAHACCGVGRAKQWWSCRFGMACQEFWREADKR